MEYVSKLNLEGRELTIKDAEARGRIDTLGDDIDRVGTKVDNLDRDTGMKITEVNNRVTNLETKIIEYAKPEQFGVTPNTPSDFNQLFANEKVVLEPVHYISNTDVVVDHDIEIVGNGATIELANGSTIVFRKDFEAISVGQNVSRGQTLIASTNKPDGSYLCKVASNEAYNTMRAYYTKGELLIVTVVNGGVFCTGTVDAYNGATISLVKPVVVGIKDLTITGNWLNNDYYPLSFYSCLGTVENVSLYAKAGNRPCAGVTLVDCYDMQFSNCVVNCGSDSNADRDAYGISIGSSQALEFDNCQFFGIRHALAIGNKGRAGQDIVDRFIRVSNCTFDSNGTRSNSCNVHGACEYIVFDNCVSFNAANFGGNHIKYRGHIISRTTGTIARLDEYTGADFDFSGTTFEALAGSGADVALYTATNNYGGTTGAGGVLNLSNCTLIDRGGAVEQFIVWMNNSAQRTVNINAENSVIDGSGITTDIIVRGSGRIGTVNLGGAAHKSGANAIVNQNASTLTIDNMIGPAYNKLN